MDGGLVPCDQSPPADKSSIGPRRDLVHVSTVGAGGWDALFLQQVQLYMLMSVEGCYTDFHLDFGGSSVWYHMVSGRKVFLLAPPTPANLAAFVDWASSKKQSAFFGDMATGLQR